MVCASSKFSIYDKTNFIMFVIGNGSVMAFVGKCWWLHNGNVDRYQNITSIGTLENERIVKRSWRKKACGSCIFLTPPFVDCFSIRWKRWYDTLPMATTDGYYRFCISGLCVAFHYTILKLSLFTLLFHFNNNDSFFHAGRSDVM